MVTCEFEDGGKAELRHVTTGAILIDKKGHILLVKRAGFLLEGGKWGLPGGYLDRDETTEQGIRREILEETGYESGALTLFMLITHPHRPNENGRQNVEFVYIAEVGELTGEPDNESTEIRWFVPDELPTGQMAFDHGELIDRYLSHLTEPETLPIVD